MRVKKLCLSLFSTCLIAPAIKTDAKDPGNFKTKMGNTIVHSFIENKGQVTNQYQQPRADIDFKLGSGNGLNVFIGNGGIHYQWLAPDDKTETENASAVPDNLMYKMYRMDMILVGANPGAQLITEEPQDFQEQYFLAQSFTKGNIAHSYRKITYKEVWPGIDWVLYIKGETVEYDFVLSSTAKASDIKLRYSGANSLRINKEGGLEVTGPMGGITERAPRSFQQDGKSIRSSFKLNKDELTFAIDDYNGGLTIDPTLEWATYYGGTDIDGEMESAACDNNGNVYITSKSLSLSNIATIGSFQTTLGGNADAFVAKFNSAGILKWATYYGGTQDDKGIAIRCDRFGHVYVAGTSKSTSGIATTGSYQATKASNVDRDVFLVKFDTLGNRDWATYYGGPSDEDLNGIACNPAGQVYIVGTTSSNSNISTPGSYQAVYVGPYYDGYVAKFDSSGTIAWSTYYGAGGDDFLYSVTSDDTGSVYVAGYTNSTLLTSAGAQQAILGGQTDALLIKFNGQGQRKWATYFGGTRSDLGYGVATDNSGNVYMTGNTLSAAGIATVGAFQDTLNGASLSLSAQKADAFLVKYDSTGIEQWGTYYGGVNAETAFSIATDPYGNCYLDGTTSSVAGIATPGAFQTAFGTGFQHTFLSRFTPAGALDYGTYFGGNGYEFTYANSIAVDKEALKIYMVGFSNSISGIATSGSYQSTFGGGSQDVFLAKFCLPASSVLQAIVGSDSICSNNTATYTATLVEGATYIWNIPSGWTQTTVNANTINVVPDNNSGTVSVQTIRCNDTSALQTINVYVQVLDPVITVNGFVLGTTAPYSNYQWLLNGSSVSSATSSTYTVAVNGAYQVVVSTNGCTDTSAVYNVTNATPSAVNNVNNIAGLISIYPNPSSDVFHIVSPVNINATVSDIEGKSLLEYKNTKNISLSGFANGIYLLRITDINGALLKVEKLLKQGK